MNVRLPKTLIARIKARSELLGISQQSVMRRCVRREHVSVEECRTSDVSTGTDNSESIPVDVPDGVTAREARARIVAALDATAHACTVRLKLEKCVRYEVGEVEAETEKGN